jgi:copper resistance protein B
VSTHVSLRLTLAATLLTLALCAPGAAAASGGAPVAPAASRDQHEGHGQAEPRAEPTATTPGAEPAAASDPARVDDPVRKLPAFIPQLTDEDRRAAFPDVEGHAVHDQAVHSFVLLDQLEWQAAGSEWGMNLDSRGWVGRDRDRLWLRAEANTERDRVGEAQAHLLYGRQISRWWDIVAGIREDFRPGPPQTWAAIGIQGLAPYWFEVEATGYVGASGRTHAKIAVEYELLVTNRLVVQPLVEVELVGKSDPERGVGAGLSTTDAGFRVRYEIRREFAPYVGVTWSTKWGETADFAEAAGEDTGGARVLTGVRLWF